MKAAPTGVGRGRTADRVQRQRCLPGPTIPAQQGRADERGVAPVGAGLLLAILAGCLREKAILVAIEDNTAPTAAVASTAVTTPPGGGVLRPSGQRCARSPPPS